MAATNLLRSLALLLLAAAPLAAQAPKPPAAGAKAAPPKAPIEAKLVFDREVFTYDASQRRDPFKPLLGKESLGPLFDDLKLNGIMYSPDPGRSIVLLQDGSKKKYRLKRGELVGNSRVVEIRPLAVRFAVENFGMIRYEVLELRQGAGAESGLTPARPQPVPGPLQPGERISDADAQRLLDSLRKARQDTAARKNSNDEPEARR